MALRTLSLTSFDITSLSLYLWVFLWYVLFRKLGQFYHLWGNVLFVIAVGKVHKQHWCSIHKTWAGILERTQRKHTVNVHYQDHSISRPDCVVDCVGPIIVLDHHCTWAYLFTPNSFSYKTVFFSPEGALIIGASWEQFEWLLNNTTIHQFIIYIKKIHMNITGKGNLYITSYTM